MTDRRATACGAVLTAVLVLAGCATGDLDGGPPEARWLTAPASTSTIDWLAGPGAEALGAVPGSTWTTQTALEVAAVCGPTDAHEGWTLSGPVVAAGSVGDGFDAGDDFALARADEPRAWEHTGFERLRLVERTDGRVDFELFVPAGEAPTWEAVEGAPIEVVFGPDRCG